MSLTKRLPNMLSVCRIAFSLMLFAFPEHPIAFITLYLICGITDILDGYLARKWHAESRLGSRLDSLSDFIFWAVVFWLFYRSRIALQPYLLGLIVLLRGINYIVTRHKFHQWGMLHTYGNKAAGLLLYIAVPVCFFMGQVPVVVWVPVGAAALFSAAEECVMPLTQKEYDPDKKGLFLNT